MAGIIISGVTLGFCALLMIAIGVKQLRSEKPVGFYSGQKPPKPSEITDIPAWNRKHGWMWILYGVLIALSYVVGLFIENENVMPVLFSVCIVLPIPLMILYHRKLEKIYLDKTQ